MSPCCRSVIPKPLVVPALAGVVVAEVVLTLLAGHRRPPAYGSPQFGYWGEALQVVRSVSHKRLPVFLASSASICALVRRLRFLGGGAARCWATSARQAQEQYTLIS